MKSWTDLDGKPLDYNNVNDEVSELYRVVKSALKAKEDDA
jgi:hypothetical protein